METVPAVTEAVPSSVCYYFAAFADPITDGNILMEFCRTPTPALVSLGYAEFTKKKGTKMKLLKQRQPRFTELLLSNTNPVSQQTPPTTSQGQGEGRALWAGQHDTAQGQINTAQLAAAVKTRAGSIRRSHWNTSSAAQNPSVTSQMGGSAWDMLCIQVQQCQSSTAALKNFCF